MSIGRKWYNCILDVLRNSKALGARDKCHESTHSTWSEAKDFDTPSGSVHTLPLQRSTPGTRRKLPSELAEKCLDLMTVEDPNEDDIVIP